MSTETGLESVDYLISTEPGDHDRVVSHRQHEPLCWSLDGTWRFHFSPTTSAAPADAAEVDLDVVRAVVAAAWRVADLGATAEGRAQLGFTP